MKVVQLDEHRSWDPQSLLAVSAALLYGTSLPLVRVREVAEVLRAATPAAAEQAVVLPSGLSPQTGAIARTRRDYAGPVHNLGTAANQLRPGDVLLPRMAGSPALLLTARHAELAFSDGFLALRPTDPAAGVLLWAILSSRRGMQVRSASSLGGSTLLGINDLLLLEMPDLSHYAAKADDLRHLAQSVPGPSPAEVASSWWRITTLPPDGQWTFELALRDPLIAREGRPLGDLAQVTVGGRPRPMAAVIGDILPVYDGVYLSRGEVRHWAPASPGTGTVAGDVLVGEVGLRGRARLVDEAGVAGVGVLRVRLHDPSQAAGLVRYLNSEPALALRASLAQGFIPRLGLVVLRQFPVPDSLSDKTEPLQPPTVALPDQLDGLLWD